MKTRAITIWTIIVCLIGLAVRDGVTWGNRAPVRARPSTATTVKQASEKAEDVPLTVVVETYLV
ncbi:MAG: hypothetical protein ACYS8Z_20880, partial [Planctomycetota bacterium]